MALGVNPAFKPDWIRKSWVWRAPYAQPIPFENHSQNIPALKTPLPEFLSTDSYGYVQVAGHRIGLRSLARCYNNGYSPEMMAGEYPTLSLATIHKVIAFYLENRDEVDRYMAECDAEPRRGVRPVDGDVFLCGDAAPLL